MKTSPFFRQWTTWIALLAVAFAIAILLVITWVSASRPVRSTSDFLQEGGVVIAGLQGITGVCVAASTIFYAVQARRSVTEMAEARSIAVRTERRQAVLAMTGAVAEVLTFTHGAMRRGKPGLFHPTSPQLQYAQMLALVSVSRSLDGLRIQGDESLTLAGAELFDATLQMTDLLADRAASINAVQEKAHELRALCDSLMADI